MFTIFHYFFSAHIDGYASRITFAEAASASAAAATMVGGWLEERMNQCLSLIIYNMR